MLHLQGVLGVREDFQPGHACAGMNVLSSAYGTWYSRGGISGFFALLILGRGPNLMYVQQLPASKPFCSSFLSLP